MAFSFTSATGPSARRIFLAVAYIAPVLAPLLLLLDLKGMFPDDWENHLWMIGYYGEYFRQHGEMPLVINLTPAVGIAQPVFYAYLLYPLLGLISAGVGSALALRLGVFALVAIQFLVLNIAGRKIFRDRWVSYTVGVSVIWATYSLTVLYNRAAIPEYFATGFLVIAVSFAASAAVEERGLWRRYFAGSAAFFLALAVGSHPPTALLAAVFALLIIAGLAVSWARGHLPIARHTVFWGTGALFGGALLVAPWVYASARFSADLSITQSSREFIFYPERCDSFWGRFAPFPYDILSTAKGASSSVPTPYLEAPVNGVLLGILIWNLALCWRYRSASAQRNRSVLTSAKVVLMLAIAWFVLLTALSLSPALANHMRFSAPYIQYVYRLVAHCNVALLIGTFASGLIAAMNNAYERTRASTDIAIAVGLTIAVLGLWIKLQHAAVVERASQAPQYGLAGDRAPLISQGQVLLAIAYDTPGAVPVISTNDARNAAEISFPVGRGGQSFGRLSSLEIEIQQRVWVRTNLVVFPWVKLRVDGNEPAPEDLGQWDRLLALRLPVGRHRIEASWVPDPIWLVLHRLSQGTLALALLSSLVGAVYFSGGGGVGGGRGQAMARGKC